MPRFATTPHQRWSPFPLRLTPIVQTVKELIDADTIGTVEHVIAFNDVPYGDVYFYDWYRNYDQVGGLFLQKATHDLDYVHYLLGQRPRVVCAMKAQRVYGGEMPFDLHCVDCEKCGNLPREPVQPLSTSASRARQSTTSLNACASMRAASSTRTWAIACWSTRTAPSAATRRTFSPASRRRGVGRGLYGYKGTIHFCWYENKIRIYKHQSPVVETIDFTGEMPHFGGDRELCLDFLRAMRDRQPSRSPIEEGILSALTCLWARESAETRRYCDVVMPA